MTKLSLGDFAINQATQENASGKALTLEDINNAEEEIIGFIYVGYGKTPLKIKRPKVESIFSNI